MHQLQATLRAQWAARQAAGQTPSRIVEPSLVAARFVHATVYLSRAPGAPELAVDIKSGTVGAFSVIASLVSPSGQHSVGSSFAYPDAYPLDAARRRFTVLINSPFTNDGFGIYSESGAWTLESLDIVTADGSLIYYGAGQLAALMPSTSVTIVNRGTPDITPPTAGDGAVLTPSISLSSATPTFLASLPVADNLSGVASVYLSIEPPSGSFGGAYVETSAPLLNGTVYPSASFNAQSVTGTYTITGFSVCDTANNCLSDSSEAGVLKTFGATSFTVTP